MSIKIRTEKVCEECSDLAVISVQDIFKQQDFTIGRMLIMKNGEMHHYCEKHKRKAEVTYLKPIYSKFKGI